MSQASLDNLRDLHLPPPPGLWPPAPGWWLVGAAVAAVTVAWLLLRHVLRRPLHAALKELATLADSHAAAPDPVRLARGVSRLLRRYALWRFPNAGAAGLTGAAWLRFLDERGGKGQFTDGIGALLETLPYRAAGAATQDIDVAPLITLARRWLRANAP